MYTDVLCGFIECLENNIWRELLKGIQGIQLASSDLLSSQPIVLTYHGSLMGCCGSGETNVRANEKGHRIQDPRSLSVAPTVPKKTFGGKNKRTRSNYWFDWKKKRTNSNTKTLKTDRAEGWPYELPAPQCFKWVGAEIPFSMLLAWYTSVHCACFLEVELVGKT